MTPAGGQSNSMASKPPKAAPELTPTRSGPTSGLRIMPCSAVPDMPRPIPASTASSTRGRRIICTTVISFTLHGGLSGSGKGEARCRTICAA